MAAPSPPGWYADPWHVGALRWWDGTRWTEHASWGGPAEPPAPLVGKELSAVPWARVAMRVMAAYLIVSSLLMWRIFGDLKQWIDDVDVSNSSGSFTQPEPPRSFGILNASQFVYWLALIAVLVWQYRAATAAQAIGHRAVRSPGMGVGGWFIPIVNIWFPYQAIRDCLPAGDPGRGRVLRWWLGYFGMSVMTFATGAALAFAPPSAASLVLAVDVILAMWWSETGVRIVDSIAASHRQSVGMTASA